MPGGTRPSGGERSCWHSSTVNLGTPSKSPQFRSRILDHSQGQPLQLPRDGRFVALSCVFDHLTPENHDL
eukprot:CAMPEP_0171680242 /NCGR_PEP_ID=MMETSP0990-20121206/56719_1 /TAXON_ID=483369 /ORGANISM="non described non described, Strain CCMP2098" /LENGTH=69 /DNA_ID=CAMNT_0012267187 /DNA_START=398 /DNA_END=607 /DNA_ORIENTATION=+